MVFLKEQRLYTCSELTDILADLPVAVMPGCSGKAHCVDGMTAGRLPLQQHCGALTLPPTQLDEVVVPRQPKAAAAVTVQHSRGGDVDVVSSLLTGADGRP